MTKRKSAPMSKIRFQAKNADATVDVTIVLRTHGLTPNERKTTTKEFALQIVRALPNLPYLGLTELDLVKREGG